MTDAHGTAPEAEPKTPMWLPALGAALFVSVALWWAVTPSAPPITPDDTAASASAAAPAAPAAAPAAPAATPAQAQALPPGAGLPPAPSGKIRLNPAVEERLKKAHEGQFPGAQPARHP